MKRPLNFNHPLNSFKTQLNLFRTRRNFKDTKRKKRDEHTHEHTDWVTMSFLELLIAAKNTGNNCPSFYHSYTISDRFYAWAIKCANPYKPWLYTVHVIVLQRQTSPRSLLYSRLHYSMFMVVFHFWNCFHFQGCLTFLAVIKKNQSWVYNSIYPYYITRG